MQDTCNGAGACTDNGFVAAGASCGSAGDTECTNPDTCDGSGTCLANDEAAGFLCGDAGTACVVQDTCNGAGACTDNGFVTAGSACGSADDTECTNPDTCDGSGACLANDEALGALCGDVGTACVNQDTCDGSGACSDNGFVAAGFACGSADDTECTNPDTCDGSGTCLANDEAAGFLCGDAGTECVVQDTCNGSGACTDNGFVTAGFACGDAADTECTNPDTCDGSGACVANDEAAGALCGDAGTACVVQDTCDGTGACTDNGFVTAGSACGSADDTECTNPDTCDGSGACLANDEALGALCGDAGTACVVQDTCDGTGACTDNGFVTAGSACGGARRHRVHEPRHLRRRGRLPRQRRGSGALCGDVGTACVVQDTCNGAGACTDNGFVTAGSACGSADDTECTNPDTCDGSGACLANDEASRGALRRRRHGLREPGHLRRVRRVLR